MGFSKQEYWSVLPFPPPGDHPDPVEVYVEVYIHTSPMDSFILAFLPGVSFILYCLEKNIITKAFLSIKKKKKKALTWGRLFRTGCILCDVSSPQPMPLIEEGLILIT